MAIYDILMLIIFIGAILFGFRKGLFWQIASVAAIFVSYFVAITFPDLLASRISAQAPWNRFAAMLILFLGTSLVIWTIYGSVSKSITKMELKGFDRQAGALLGAFKGAVLCMLATMFAVSLLGPSARDAIHRSYTGGWVVAGIQQFHSLAPADLAQYVDDFNQNIVGPDGQLPPINNPLNGDSTPYFANDPQSFQGQWQTPPDTSQAGFRYGSNSSQPPYSNSDTSYRGPYGGQANSGSNYSGGYNDDSGYTSSQSQYGQPSQSSQPAYRPPSGTSNQTLPGGSSWDWGRGFESGNSQPSQTPAAGGQWSDNLPTVTRGENGWPDVNVKVNTQDVIRRAGEAAIEAGRNAWEQSTRP